MTSNNASATNFGDQRPPPEDESLQPPWVWTQSLGWRQLEEEGLTRGAGNLWGYFADTQDWESFGSPNFLQEQQVNQGSYYGGKGFGQQNKDGDIPEWDGHKSHRSIYFRKIEIWEETTGVIPEERGVRLLGKLSGEAFEKMEHIRTKDFRRPDSVEYFKECITNAYEPVEDYRVGKIMDHFLEDFSRKKGQEIVDFNRAWDNVA